MGALMVVLTIILVCIYDAPALLESQHPRARMYICMCHAINDRQIREVVQRGAANLRDVQTYLPVASCCGQCEDSANELIQSQLESTEGVIAA